MLTTSATYGFIACMRIVVKTKDYDDITLLPAVERYAFFKFSKRSDEELGVWKYNYDLSDEEFETAIVLAKEMSEEQPVLYCEELELSIGME